MASTVRLTCVWLAAAAFCVAGFSARAQTPEPRVALVIGNGGYGQGAAAGALPTALNDAGLVAESLRSIGFDVTEGADLKQADLLAAFKNFAAKVEASGPTTITAFYFSGYGLTLENENLLVAADAVLEGDTDIPLDTVRLSEVMKPLGALPARAKIFVIDAARKLPFPLEGIKLAPGLSALDAPPQTLVGFAAAPGALAADSNWPYGAYALAFAEMIRTGGFGIDDVFSRIRLRTHQVTQGAQTPWQASSLGNDVTLAAGDAGAPSALRHGRPMREIGADEAYALAVQQDMLAGYAEFIQTFPASAYAPRIVALLRTRRETMTWQRAFEADTAQAYWTYQRRYPDGLYAGDAALRLTRLSAALMPPPNFEQMTFADVPPPLANEPVRMTEPAAVSLPSRLMPPRPALFASLAPPARQVVQRAPRTGRNVLPAAPSLPAVALTRAPAAATNPPPEATKPQPRAKPVVPRRPARVAPPQAAAPATPGFPPAAAPARPAPPRSLAPPAQQQPRPPATTQPRPAAPQSGILPPPGCIVQNGMTLCRQ
ncbi:MAG: caspase family protein [Nitrobacter sp.]